MRFFGASFSPKGECPLRFHEVLWKELLLYVQELMVVAVADQSELNERRGKGA